MDMAAMPHLVGLASEYGMTMVSGVLRKVACAWERCHAGQWSTVSRPWAII